MNLFFFGCRGSTPVSGAEYQRYGTATSCVGIGRGTATSFCEAAAAKSAPHLVLDAGTGFVNLERVLDGEPFRGSVCITHLHWDHTHGLPFLREAYMEGHRVDIYVPGQGDAGDAETVMNRAFSPPHFPVPVGTLGDAWSVTGIEPGTFELEGFRIDAREIPHKGSRTFGYRVSDGVTSIAYLPDHKPLALGPGPEGLGEHHPAALALAEGVDLLIHDSQHTAAEMPRLAFLGHSAVEYAVGLGVAAGARAVALFHHDPHRTDDQIDELVSKLAAPGVRVFAAREGMVLSLGPRERDAREVGAKVGPALDHAERSR
ncbi:MAG: MBL fold metallo-hydrolase [Actinomycetota bacterium]|nr:MBL fold metallo-hydrolase [Actinomycetota bacterium]